jgi:hypothetical protein
MSTLSAPANIWSILGLIIAVAVALVGFFKGYVSLSERVKGTEGNCNALGQRMEDWMKMMDLVLAKVMRDWPTHMERDILMDKLARQELTLEEVERLDVLLKGAMRESDDSNRQLMFGMARARLTWLRSQMKEGLNA